MPDTTHLNLYWSSLLVEEAIRLGSDYFCLSPGSRSAPLTVAVLRTPAARWQICYDERAAAFHALGWARATGKPAVLICTSGSALAHYFPAVVEASQDRLPLLILSADRPPELLALGANQAIRQPDFYGDYARWHFSLPTPSAEIAPVWVRSTLVQAWLRASDGPVHLNLPFREPLAPRPEPLPAGYETRLPAFRISRSRPAGLGPEAYAELLAQLRSAPGLLILGQLAADEREPALAMAQALGWPVFADVLSGLRLDARLPQIQAFDQLLALPDFAAACRFEQVLHLGGAYVSGRLLRLLAAHPPAQFLQFHQGPQRQDPNAQVTWQGDVGLADFCQELCLRLQQAPLGPPQAQGAFLQACGSAAEAVLAAELDGQAPLSEPAVARLLTRLLPPEHALMLGNSLAIREVDGFGQARLPAPVVFGQRGTSGIDGHVAGAAGLAIGRRAPVTLLCGDLTLFHDLNSLHLLGQLAQPVTIVLINNAGGGIFSFLPIAEHPDIFEAGFGTPHELSFSGAAAMFGLDYSRPTDLGQLSEALQASWRAGRPALIEVCTVRSETLAVHRQLQAQLARAVATL